MKNKSKGISYNGQKHCGKLQDYDEKKKEVVKVEKKSN